MLSQEIKKKPTILDSMMEWAKEKKREEYRKADAARFQKERLSAIKPYEDAEEKFRMVKANPKVLEQLNRFIGELATMKCETALEVACGAAHCTKMVLSKKFYKIDLFDESQGAVTDAIKNLEGVERVGQVAKSRMQDYTFD